MSDDMLRMEQILRQIKQEKGADIFQDWDQLMEMYEERAFWVPEVYQVFLRIFRNTQGLRVFLHCQNDNSYTQKSCFAETVQAIRDTYFFQEDYVLEMCRVLWKLIVDTPVPEYAPDVYSAHVVEEIWIYDIDPSKKLEAAEKLFRQAQAHRQKKELADAFERFQRAARLGHVAAMYALAVAYECGEGTTQNTTEAVNWYRNAAALGHDDAQAKLGVCYCRGSGVQRSYPEAAKWLLKAAKQGNMRAQYNLAILYERGYGVAQNYNQAITWYRKSAEQGWASAQTKLGCFYQSDHDYTEAVKWHSLAAQQGNATAQFNLGLCYQNGYGVQKDRQTARAWYEKAAAQGDEEAARRLAAMGKLYASGDKERILYGAILGDIIGSPYEFDRGDKTKEFPLFSDQSEFTDDTVMTIAVAEALMQAGKDADVDVIRRHVIHSMQSWGRRYPCAGYGIRFNSWLADENPKPYGSFGNGSAMRVSAAGWLYDSLERTLEVARATAEVTHNHAEGAKGAEATAAAIYLARTGSTKAEIKRYICEEFQYDLSRTCDEIRPGYNHVESCQETVPEAITAFLEGNSFEDVIRTAVSLGGDCDTLTAIAGSIAEAFYGVPDTLKNECGNRLPEEMLDVLDAF